jgi:hypothetical protein
MLGTRPESAHAIAPLGHAANSGFERLRALDHLFRHLRETPDFKLVCSGSDEEDRSRIRRRLG